MPHFKNMIASLLILTCILNTACSGEECSATSSAFSDTDSDCVDDSGDNCVGFYNPDQFDGDEDGLGYACDYDDTDDSIAFVKDDLEPDSPPSSDEDDSVAAPQIQTDAGSDEAVVETHD